MRGHLGREGCGWDDISRSRRCPGVDAGRAGASLVHQGTWIGERRGARVGRFRGGDQCRLEGGFREACLWPQGTERRKTRCEDN